MNNIKKYIAIFGITLVIFGMVLLGGCIDLNSNNNKNSFIGSWEREIDPNHSSDVKEIWTFFEKKTLERLKTVNGAETTTIRNWELNNSKLCIYDDDMTGLYQVIQWADAIVIGSPVYFGTISGLLKNFMDRTRPLYILKNILSRIIPNTLVGGAPKIFF